MQRRNPGNLGTHSQPSGRRAASKTCPVGQLFARACAQFEIPAVFRRRVGRLCVLLTLDSECREPAFGTIVGVRGCPRRGAGRAAV